jgi:hypothetical protein
MALVAMAEAGGAPLVVMLREDGQPVSISAAAFADLVSAYHTLRAFSWQLRLSPFSLQVRELCDGVYSWCKTINCHHQIWR